MSDQSPRPLSAALFGNEKFAEVVVALGGQRGAATAQQLSKLTRIDHSMVRNVLLRAVAAKIVDHLPRTGGSRSKQYYQPSPGDLWEATFVLARIVVGDIVRVTT